MQLFDTETPRCCNNVVSCKFKELKKISATNWDKLDKENVSNLWNRTVLAAATKCLMSKRQSLTMIMMVLFFNATIAKYGGEVHVISTSWTLTWYMPLYIMASRSIYSRGEGAVERIFSYDIRNNKYKAMHALKNTNKG